MREPVTKVFRRAGCGKSARPVRRGDGESRILPLLIVLLYRPSVAFHRFFHSFLTLGAVIPPR
jgi:hypothetical protein